MNGIQNWIVACLYLVPVGGLATCKYLEKKNMEYEADGHPLLAHEKHQQNAQLFYIAFILNIYFSFFSHIDYEFLTSYNDKNVHT